MASSKDSTDLQKHEETPTWVSVTKYGLMGVGALAVLGFVFNHLLLFAVLGGLGAGGWYWLKKSDSPSSGSSDVVTPTSSATERIGREPTAADDSRRALSDFDRRLAELERSNGRDR